MKKIITGSFLTLIMFLSACDKSEVRPVEEQKLNAKSIQAKRIDRIEFEVGAEPFEFVNLDEPKSNDDDLRANKITLESKGFDKTPHISVDKNDIDSDLIAWVVGHGTRDYMGCPADLSQSTNPSKGRGYKITTNADGSQKIFLGFFDQSNRNDAFYEGQYVAMYFSGRKNVYRHQYDNANDNICLIKDGELNKREIPLITDFVKLQLSQKDGNGGGSPNTGTISANFKPRGSLIAMSLENKTGFQIEVKGIKILQPLALACRGFLENADIEGGSLMNGAGTTFTDYSYPVPFIPEHTNDEFEYPFYARPNSTDFLQMTADEKTSGRFYVWGYPIKTKETEPVIAQIQYTKVGDTTNKLYYSVPQKIDPKGKSWTSGKAYRCNFIISHQFEYDKIFGNEMMTELKPGITEADINKIPEKAFRDLALALLNGTYDKEFRVNDYKLFPNPNIQARENKTWAYSLRDNPTGIEVETDQTLIVVVGDNHNIDNTKLLVQNLDTPSPAHNGFSHTTEYKLKRGINRIKIKEKGLVYIQYLKDDLQVEGKPELDVHFINGKVNGYFDSQDPKMTGKGGDIIAKAKGKFFDLVGKYAHLTFPTKDHPRTNDELVELIGIYDKIVEKEMEFLGLFKYDKVFKNRMYFNPMYDYPAAYATSYHVSFGIGNSPSMLNINDLKSTTSWSLWGQAHEVGHMNQTGDFRWYGVGEVTNNIMSKYITVTIFGQPSRTERESLYACPNNNRYANAFNMILVPKKSQPESENGERLIPLWQLQLYFGNILGRTPDKDANKGGFYPDVYEYFRTHTRASTNFGDTSAGLEQTEFPFIASKVAGFDLTEFFEKWGYLKAFNGPSYNNDYGGSADVTITQARVDEVKQRIKALNLPKLPNIPLEYLTDRSVEIFKNNLSIVAGSPAQWDKTNTDVNVARYITISGWQNVVAYEIWDKPYGTNGATLLYAGDGVDTANPNGAAKLNIYHTDHIFPGPQNVDKYYFDINQQVYLYAVGADNSRVLVPFN